MSNYRTELIQVAAAALAAAQVAEVDTTALGINTAEAARGQGSLENLLAEVREERRRQELKFGTQNGRDAPPDLWLVLLAEELGEVAEEITKKQFRFYGSLDIVRDVIALGWRARAFLELR